MESNPLSLQSGSFDDAIPSVVPRYWNAYTILFDWFTYTIRTVQQVRYLSSSAPFCIVFYIDVSEYMIHLTFFLAQHLLLLNSLPRIYLSLSPIYMARRI